MNVSLTISDAVAWLTLERAEQKNAITLAMWRQIAGLAKEVASSSARALVLRGQSGCFCSGADLDELTNIDSIDAARNYWLGMKSALDGMAEIKIPKIAMIEKYCLGGGCILALTCDLRYATKETVFGIPVAKHGYTLDTATVARLTALIGPARTKELIFLANTISGDEALSIGLVNRLFEPNQIESELKGIITRITEANADSVKQIKAQVDRVVATMTADESTVKQDENMIIQQFLSSSRKP